MAICRFCSRRFRNPQSVRAHQRHCLAYQAKKLLPKARLPIIGSTSASECVPATRTQRGRLLALNVEEKLRHLLKLCREHAEAAHFIGRLFGWTGFNEWKDLFFYLGQAHRDAEMLVNGFTNNPAVPLQLYQQVSSVKERWIMYREQQITGSGHSPEGYDDKSFNEDKKRYGICDEQIAFEALIAELKQLVAICPQ
jgi:hypothetical protein